MRFILYDKAQNKHCNGNDISVASGDKAIVIVVVFFKVGMCCFSPEMVPLGILFFQNLLTSVDLFTQN